MGKENPKIWQLGIGNYTWESMDFGLFINGEEQRTSVCCLRRRAPPHPESVPACGSRRIHQMQIQWQRWKTSLDGGGGGSAAADAPRQSDAAAAVPPKHERKVSYWTEGVPSVKKTDFGRAATSAKAR